ncbi:unnamed protein product [Cylindrotheca closterium]|uniref:Uncharacterized protein n=1 Tax=Cylindrotheca closterium TaxID=2856 RepID=A0AAD2CK39_9STRA|nr:unnamed protein product [Cylindrotheca closterium]
MMLHQSVLLLTAIVATLVCTSQASSNYGVDCSWPIHSKNLTCGNLLGDRKAIYEDYMEGCREHWGEKGRKRCNAAEADRLEMSRKQPQSMVNFTSTGFKKLKAPAKLWELLSEFWEENEDEQEIEEWFVGNVYTNNWAAPSYYIGVEDTELEGGGPDLRNEIWEAARPVLEEWTGRKLQPTSQYGIRIYTEGAILAPHVDRLPLVSSCIINVAQDVDEDWILEVYDRNDNAVNVTMEPGDMVLYESGSLMHGRPFALKGRYFANIFIHFEPTGEDLDGNAGRNEVVDDDFYPPYLLPNSPWLETWAQQNPSGWRRTSPSAASVGVPKAHAAAASGDVDALERLAFDDKESLSACDANGWTPLHEAARAGHLEVVQMLVEKQQVDINSLTNKGKGSSAYFIASQSHSPDHPVAKYLQSLGAINQGPEL